MTWVLRPAKTINLPKKQLTPEQQAENDAALAAHQRRLEEIDALTKKLEALGKTISYDDDDDDYDDDDDPQFVPPHDPEAVDVERLNRQEKAYYEYLEATKNSYFASVPVDIGKELVAAGIGVRWAEVGMISVGVFPYHPTPPPLPDWAK